MPASRSRKNPARWLVFRRPGGLDPVGPQEVWITGINGKTLLQEQRDSKNTIAPGLSCAIPRAGLEVSSPWFARRSAKRFVLPTLRYRHWELDLWSETAIHYEIEKQGCTCPPYSVLRKRLSWLGPALDNRSGPHPVVPAWPRYQQGRFDIERAEEPLPSCSTSSNKCGIIWPRQQISFTIRDQRKLFRGKVQSRISSQNAPIDAPWDTPGTVAWDMMPCICTSAAFFVVPQRAGWHLQWPSGSQTSADAEAAYVGGARMRCSRQDWGSPSRTMCSRHASVSIHLVMGSDPSLIDYRAHLPWRITTR